MFELNYSLLDVWNQPALKILRWGTKKTVQAISSAHEKSKNAEISTSEFAELLSEAEAGNAEAQCELAIYYFQKKDNTKGTEWLIKSASLGNETALEILDSIQLG